MRRVVTLLIVVSVLAVSAPVATAAAATHPVSHRPAVAAVTTTAVGGGRGIGWGLGRIARALVRSGVPPVVVYSIIGGAILSVAGASAYRRRRDAEAGSSSAARDADAHLSAKLRDEQRPRRDV